MARSRRKKKKKNQFGLLAITFVVIALALVLQYQTRQLEKKNEEYQMKLAAIEEDISEEALKALNLEESRITVQTKQYIKEQAKSKLGLVEPDEIILKPNRQ